MKRPLLAHLENSVRLHFGACAAVIVTTAADDVCWVTGRVRSHHVPGLTRAELGSLNAFAPHPDFLEEQKRLVVGKFVTGQHGAKRLYAMVHQNVSQVAIRCSVAPYSRSFGIPALNYFQNKYEFLFSQLALPVYRVNQVDPNLNNDMPHSPVRRGLVRSDIKALASAKLR